MWPRPSTRCSTPSASCAGGNPGIIVGPHEPGQAPYPPIRPRRWRWPLLLPGCITAQRKINANQAELLAEAVAESERVAAQLEGPGVGRYDIRVFLSNAFINDSLKSLAGYQIVLPKDPDIDLRITSAELSTLGALPALTLQATATRGSINADVTITAVLVATGEPNEFRIAVQSVTPRVRLLSVDVGAGAVCAAADHAEGHRCRRRPAAHPLPDRGTHQLRRPGDDHHRPSRPDRPADQQHALAPCLLRHRAGDGLDRAHHQPALFLRARRRLPVRGHAMKVWALLPLLLLAAPALAQEAPAPRG